jgi:hypothetical protein
MDKDVPNQKIDHYLTVLKASRSFGVKLQYAQFIAPVHWPSM